MDVSHNLSGHWVCDPFRGIFRDNEGYLAMPITSPITYQILIYVLDSDISRAIAFTFGLITFS